MRYVRSVDQAEREKLVEDHLDLANRAARMVYARVKQHVEFDDLVGLGTIGLAEASQRFDPTRGVPFGAFAWYRVQGAIIDGLRRNANLPRSVWLRLVALRAAAEYLEHQIERDAGATKQGIAPAAGADALAAIKGAMGAIRTMYLTSLEGLSEDKGFDPKAETVDPRETIDSNRMGAKIRAAIAELPDRERELVTKHYFEGKNLLDAGAELGISKSWASRLHGQAVDRLRKAIDDG
jgi:RNA polymerase sigma factor for flagellar operon FliA